MCGCRLPRSRRLSFTLYEAFYSAAFRPFAFNAGANRYLVFLRFLAALFAYIPFRLLVGMVHTVKVSTAWLRGVCLMPPEPGDSAASNDSAVLADPLVRSALLRIIVKRGNYADTNAMGGLFQSFSGHL